MTWLLENPALFLALVPFYFAIGLGIGEARQQWFRRNPDRDSLAERRDLLDALHRITQREHNR